MNEKQLKPTIYYVQWQQVTELDHILNDRYLDITISLLTLLLNTNSFSQIFLVVSYPYHGLKWV